jgi:peroxiredoxin
LDVVSLEVIAALANELSLLEVAQRTRMVWDELAVIIQKLESGGIIRNNAKLAPQMRAAPSSRSENVKPAKRIRNRLIAGDMAPDFVLPGLNNTSVRLSDYRGKRVLLRFNRQAGCPICNPRNREFIRLYPHFQEANTEIIGIFGSPEDVMPLGIGMQNPPYPVLADPKDAVYAEYGVERSLWGLLSPQNWKNMPGVIEGSKMESFRAAGEGEATRMPAEFLIDENGRIEQVHYHAFATDFLPLDVLFSDWLKIKS